MGVRADTLDFVFLSYDEPNAEEHWQHLSSFIPHARHVHGVKGFARAHLQAAAVAETEYFFTVDADTRLMPTFTEHVIDEDKLNAGRVICWPSRNVVNGLAYGHGGVKCWGRKMLRDDPTRDDSFVDHILTLSYIFEPKIISTCHPNPTPLHAFRAGFRESLRLVLIQGQTAEVERSFESVAKSNQERIRIWCSLGADSDHGLWCIYGARLGLASILLGEADLALMRDFDVFQNFFQTIVAPPLRGTDETCPFSGVSWSSDALKEASYLLGEKLRREVGLDIVDFDADQSAFIKEACHAELELSTFDMQGNLYRHGEGLPQDSAKAAELYRVGGGLGHSNALNNLARLYLRGEGVARDDVRAVTLLWQASALGNAFAPHQLARMRLKGWGMERDADAAVRLLELSATRGFQKADFELGQLFEAGDEVSLDVVRALRHYLLAGKIGQAAAEALAEQLAPDQLVAARTQAESERRTRRLIG